MKNKMTKSNPVEKLSDLLKNIMSGYEHPPHIKQIEEKYHSENRLIPKDHPDHGVIVSHINKLMTSGQAHEAGRLHDKLLTGGGDVTRDVNPPVNKLKSGLNKSEESGILLVSYDDGSIDLIIADDVPEALEKTAVEYLRHQGYDEILEKGLKAEHKSKKGGMTAAGVAAYRRENPGSKLQTAVAEKNPKGKRAARRRSFCARMSGVKGPMKDKKGRPTRKALALRRWRC